MEEYANRATGEFKVVCPHCSEYLKDITKEVYTAMKDESSNNTSVIVLCSNCGKTFNYTLDK